MIRVPPHCKTSRKRLILMYGQTQPLAESRRTLRCRRNEKNVCAGYNVHADNHTIRLFLSKTNTAMISLCFRIFARRQVRIDEHFPFVAEWLVIRSVLKYRCIVLDDG